MTFDLPGRDNGPLFSLGDTYMTSGVQALADEDKVDPSELITRHVRGDFGDLDQHDLTMNNLAIENGDRILSRYEVNDHAYYVITESSREVTTVLLVEEY